jgi:hypothetical protein
MLSLATASFQYQTLTWKMFKKNMPQCAISQVAAQIRAVKFKDILGCTTGPMIIPEFSASSRINVVISYAAAFSSGKNALFSF